MSDDKATTTAIDAMEQPHDDMDKEGIGGGSMFYVKRPKDVSGVL